MQTTVRGNITLTAFACILIRYLVIGVVFATGEPDVPVQKLDFGATSIDLEGAGTEKALELTVTPAQATTEVQFEISAGGTYASCEKIDNRNVKVTAKATGTATLKATAGNVSTTLTINVTTNKP